MGTWSIGYYNVDLGEGQEDQRSMSRGWKEFGHWAFMFAESGTDLACALFLGPARNTNLSEPESAKSANGISHYLKDKQKVI